MLEINDKNMLQFFFLLKNLIKNILDTEKNLQKINIEDGLENK